MAEIPLSEFLIRYAGRKVGRELSDSESKDVAKLTSRAEVQAYLAESASAPSKKKSSRQKKKSVVKDDDKKQ